MYKIFILILSLLVFSSCSYVHEEGVEFYRGEKHRANRIATLCDAYRLPVEFVKVSDQVTALKGPKELQSSYQKLLRGVEPYFSDAEVERSSLELRDFFIPKKATTTSLERMNIDLNPILARIGDARFILRVQVGSSSEIVGETEINLYYVDHPAIEGQVIALLNDLTKSNKDLRLKKTAISLDLNVPSETEDPRATLSVFEPFSFRILNSERNLAGMQFLLLLLLFLLSGFILGLWWKGRAS